MTRLTFEDLVLDATDADRAAAFWATATGLAAGPRRGDTIALTDPFASGATLLSAPDGGREWWVLASPEGHEFCVFEHRD